MKHKIQKKIKIRIKKKKNKKTKLILPLKYARSIWYISYLHFFTSTYALFNKCYVLSLFGYGSMCTSLNYWRYPEYDSWRRYFDIIFIQISLYIHLYYAFSMRIYVGYIYFITNGILSYGISNYYQKNNNYLSTLFHILVHIFAMIGNGILYSGEIE